MKAMGDLQGPEVDYLRDALKKARQAAQERPLTSQMTECRRFIERSERRLEKINAEREAETVQLEEARNRLTRLEAQAAALLSEVAGRGPRRNANSRIVRASSIEGRFRAHVRRRHLSMDAGSSGRYTRCNVGRQWSRGGQVVPRLGNRSDKLVNTHTVHGVQRSPAMRRVSVYGYCGVRVGEASHPGPLHRLRRGSDRSRSPATRVTGLRRVF